MNLLYTDNLTNLSTNYLINPGKYGGFLIRYSGTAQAGQTVTLANLGNVIFNAEGKDKINVDAEFLSFAANLYGGFIEADSAVGGAFNFSIWIPSGVWFDPVNILDLRKDKDATFKLDFPAMTAALIASGNVQISGILQPGVQKYYHTMFSYNVVAGGAGVLTNTIAKSNIIELYIKNPAALISTVQLSKDNVTYVNGNIANELAYSNWIHQIEATGTFYAQEFASSKNIAQASGRNLTFNYNFTGAGTLAQYYSAVEWIAGGR